MAEVTKEKLKDLPAVVAPRLREPIPCSVRRAEPSPLLVPARQ